MVLIGLGMSLASFMAMLVKLWRPDEQQSRYLFFLINANSLKRNLTIAEEYFKSYFNFLIDFQCL